MNRALLAAGFAALLIVLVIVVAVGRGGDDDSSGSAGDEITDTSTKPSVEVPDADPPAELVIEDIVEGDGAEAAAGDQVTVQYVGVDYATGEQFDASWDGGEPFSFELGSGEVIEGWDEGVQGMGAGGRRELTIPPDLAYGAQGSPPAIGPGATLVFVVDLLSVE
jgi:peptidylprolyl isomerase